MQASVASRASITAAKEIGFNVVVFILQLRMSFHVDKLITEHFSLVCILFFC